MTGVIDLGDYLRILIRRWRLVALVTLVGLIGGIALALSQPAAYTSTATLLVKPAPANLSVTAPATSTGINPVLDTLAPGDVAPRTLAVFGRSSAVEERVRKRLGDRLPPSLGKPGALLARVRVEEVAGRPNAIGVTTTYSRASDATEISNAWAQEASGYLNELVGVGSFELQRSGAQLQAVQAQLDKAQADLTAFEKSSNIPALSSQLAAATSLLADYERQSNQMQLNLGNAAALRAQLQPGRAPAATSLPVMLLALSTFTTQATGVDVAASLPSQAPSAVADQAGIGADANRSQAVRQPAAGAQTGAVIVQPTLGALTALTPVEQAAFLDSLTAVLRTRGDQVNTQITALRSSISDLRSQLEAASAQRDRLVTNRDVSRATYSSLLGLIQQRQVSSQIQSEKVVVGDLSVRAARAGVSSKTLWALGLIVGLMLGVLLAFLMEFIRSVRRSPRVEPTAG